MVSQASQTFRDVSQLWGGGSGHGEPSALQDARLLVRELRVCDGHGQRCGLYIHLHQRNTTPMSSSSSRKVSLRPQHSNLFRRLCYIPTSQLEQICIYFGNNADGVEEGILLSLWFFQPFQSCGPLANLIISHVISLASGPVCSVGKGSSHRGSEAGELLLAITLCLSLYE